MSILSEKTEKKALYEIAKTLRFFENLELLQVSHEDALNIRNAERIISRTIVSNGYAPCYNKHKGTYLIKLKP